MPIKLVVRSNDHAARTQRQATAAGVTEHFVMPLHDSRVLCFLDDDDPQTLKQTFGLANRGLYRPIRDNTPLAVMPEYVSECIFVDDGKSFYFPRIVDDLIYLYGSTCLDEVGLTMTLAHELQHATQHVEARNLWAVNRLFNQLPRSTILALGLKWTDIPIEQEARIVSKCLAERLFGKQRVEVYIDRKIREHVTDDDADDWTFVRSLSCPSRVDLVASTRALFQRVKARRSEIDAALARMKDDPDSADIDLSPFL